MPNPRELANKVLKDHGTLTAPISLKPICDALGLKVKFCEFNDSGISGRVYPSKNEIYINFRNHPHRQRFTLAHEIGHYLLHRGLKKEFLDEEFFNMDERLRTPVEDEASIFASHLLMPDSLLFPVLKEQNVVDGVIDRDAIADRFGVSPAAVDFRMNELMRR